MLSFVNDYSEGAHENIIRKIAETALEKNPGYGSDKYCRSAADKIRAACACPDADVYFMAGGTETNQVVIDSLLSAHEGVVSADTGHVNAHEAGAIEFTGHKVLALPGREGKLEADVLSAYLRAFFADENREHMVFPGMVYISHPTEYGTLYTKAELSALHNVCGEYSLPLYLDGARLGYALACRGSDVSLPNIAALTDVFYIGGTKVGALFGEAAVFTRGAPAHFVNSMKRHGALLAKGWLLGLQFDVLFTDGLYFRIGEKAIAAADDIRRALKEKGYRFLLDSPTNQIMIVLENGDMAKLAEKVAFSYWERVDDSHTAIRICTSWATDDADVQALINLL